MTTWPSHWPTEARTIARTVSAAIDAVRRDDSRLITANTEELAALPHGYVLDLQAAVLRTVLEHTHPDGLTAEHIGQLVDDVLISCALREVHPETLSENGSPDRMLVTMVLLGALGIDVDPAFFAGDNQVFGDNQDVDDVPELPQYAAQEKVLAATLLLTALLDRLQAEPGQFVIMAMTEIERAQSVEMP